MHPVRIGDLKAGGESALSQAATLLWLCFRDNWPDAWPDQEAALQEVQEALQEERICLGAFMGDGQLLGWIGGQSSYHGRGWELHPLAVHPSWQLWRIGWRLVADFEDQVRQRGGLTILVGTDDESGMTSLSGIDLYPHLWEHIANIRNLRRHPYEFYRKLGYTITGVIPDANGRGKPDILMAKRVA